jgi:hypothetical protein
MILAKSSEGRLTPEDRGKVSIKTGEGRLIAWKREKVFLGKIGETDFTSDKGGNTYTAKENPRSSGAGVVVGKPVQSVGRSPP